MDHIVPRNQGGSDAITNLQALCFRCNAGKRDTDSKPPSAELRPDQRDSDSLPDYAVLDPILRRLIEELASPEQLVAGGADPALVERIWSLLRRAEFKRRQAAPALKVSPRSFGSGWRMPIAAG